MSSKRKNCISLLIRNGLRAISLLVLGVASLISFACGSSKGTVKNDVTVPKKDMIRQEIIEDARTQLGRPYLYAGNTPKGFDCSGFSFFIMKQNNIQLNRTSDQQSKQGKPIAIKDAREADLLFFGSKSKVSHVGIITKNRNGKLVMIHSSSSRGIVEEDISKSDYWQSRLLYAKDILN